MPSRPGHYSISCTDGQGYSITEESSLRAYFGTFKMQTENWKTSVTSLATIKTLCLLIIAVALTTVVTYTYLTSQMTSVPPKITNVLPKITNEAIIRDLLVQPKPTESTWDYNWDKRDWKEHPERRITGIRKLYLVRHGEYGQDLSLTPLGREQAAMTGQQLAKLQSRLGTHGKGFEMIHHSTMARAQETASIIHESLKTVPIWVDDILKEGAPVQPVPNVDFWSMPARQYWEDAPRVEAAFRRYFHRADAGQNNTASVIVAHANLIRFCILRSLQLKPEAWLSLYLAHGSITQVVINPDSRVVVGGIGDAGHIPYDKQTG